MTRVAWFLAILSAIGCATEVASVDPPASAAEPDSASRAIIEADIIQVDGGRLYAISRSGQLTIVDISVRDRLIMLGRMQLTGQPFEMYLKRGALVAMSNQATEIDGSAVTPQNEGSAYPRVDPNRGALVSVIDVRDPSKLTVLGRRTVPGEIADSRFVGDILYLATYENASCFQCGSKPRTLVTSFDFSDSRRMQVVAQVSFESNAPDGYNLPWGSNWKRSIVVNQDRLYIGGHADIDPNELGRTTEGEGIIDVLDVTDPRGSLVRGARLRVAGAILSRWQVDERDGILRVVSQQGAGRTGNGLGLPEIATFRIDRADAFVPLGRTSIQLPRQEGLRTVRFDADRAYAITYNQTDPLFTIDLSRPEDPKVRGELEMPGFMFHLEPYGDRVIGLGIDRTDPLGNLNVSVFDVSDLSNPTMLDRVSFAGTTFGEDYQILNGELPEDQDRIQKAFRVFDDGIVAVPFSSRGSCGGGESGVQLIKWRGDDLEALAHLPLPGNPRRAFEQDGRMLIVSDSNLRSFTLEGQQTADLLIGTCTMNAYERSYDAYGFGCSCVARRPSFNMLPILLVTAVSVLARRRARSG